MLNKEQLKQDLNSLYQAVKSNNQDEDKCLDAFVDGMAEVLIKHIKTLEIVYTAGLTAPNGAVTGTINHSVK